MSESEIEIDVEDPDAPSDQSPPLAYRRGAEAITMAALMALALVMGFDNWRTGIAWSADGPAPGSFPFSLAVILFLASGYGLMSARGETAQQSGVFVTRDQLKRVSQVFVPTLAFCLATQWLGLYVASFLLITGFMRFIGHIAWWKSVVTGLAFSALMFVTFQIAFDVIMPKGPIEALFGY